MDPQRNDIDSASSAASAASQSSAAPSQPSASATTTAAAAHAALPDPSLPAPALAAEDVGFTAADLIARQARLEAQATEAIPFKFDTCTYSMGYIRQPVYACKTCGGGGVCAGCSVSCHAEHDLVELFNKRHFRCDCGTPNLYKDRQPNRSSSSSPSRGNVSIDAQLEYPPGASPCTLRKPGFDPQNEENRYNHNFEGGFCHCVRGRTYDPESEDETMFQCLVCEEWLHESCTSLRPPPPLTKADMDADAARKVLDDGEPPLIDHDLFDLMICDVCVRKEGNEMLRSYAGSRGWMMLLPSQQCATVTSWDGIPSIRVPTDESKAAAGPHHTDVAAGTQDANTAAHGNAVPQPADVEASSATRADEPSWQLFGLKLHEPTADEDDKVADGGTEAAAATTASNAAQPAGAAAPSDKRKAADDAIAGVTDGQDDATTKRVKVDHTEAETNAEQKVERSTSTCTVPGIMPLLKDVPALVTDDYVPALSKDGSDSDDATPRQRYDIFLSEEFRSRICRCLSCLARWSGLPFVLDVETTYSPPSDHEGSQLHVDNDDAASVSSSTYDLGMAALRTMPREKMLNSLQAYNSFRDALWEHLRPFAGSGKMVSEEDVKAFFRKQKEGEK